MRFFCTFLALGVGSLVLVPESAEACHRRGARGGYVAAPVSYHTAPSYHHGGYHHGGYHPGSGFYVGGYYPGTYPQYHRQPMYTYPPGGFHHHPQPPVLMPPPTTATSVAAVDDKFDPPTLTVAPGTTVRWTNKGDHKHTVTAATGAFDSGDIAPGGVYSATFTKTGTFEYYCKHHKDMKGTIIVK